jgi:CHAD domain-containing protein
MLVRRQVGLLDAQETDEPAGKDHSGLAGSNLALSLARCLQQLPSTGADNATMAFRLRPHESVKRGLRRLMKKELQSSRDELLKTIPPSDEAIHEARKSIKKVRAILDLIRADDGQGLGGTRKRLREISHTLSRLRDADAMVETLDAITKNNRAVISEPALTRIHRRLAARKRIALETAHGDGAWKTIERDCRKLQKIVGHARSTHRRFGALAPGIRDAYRGGRKAMARARTGGRAADFHEWRKHIKTLWYQLRLLEGCSAAVGKDVASLHRVETYLGDDHNVVVLCETLSADLAGHELEPFRRAAARYQRQLRRKAFASATRTYGRTTVVFMDGIQAAWKEFQRHDRRHRTRGHRKAVA